MKHITNKIIISVIISLSVFSCSNQKIFSKQEIIIITQDSSAIMKIYKIDNPADTSILRAKSIELSDKEITSSYYKLLSNRMLKTVTDSTIDGVGIAGPQVGINRRIIAVQRYDKPGAPFEVFPNIYIKEYSKDTTMLSEGCLSVPDTTGKVERSKWIIISYTNPKTMTRQQDTIKGFTSIIFQHETDHLEGIIYTDRMTPFLASQIVGK